jgi:hypothetical protein
MTQAKDTTAWLDDAAAGWKAKLAELPFPTRWLYDAIVQTFLTQGRPPDQAQLHAMATEAGVDLAGALADLTARDLLVADAATGSISAAYPFSGTPTAHQVAIEDGPAVYAMCAVDALGIPFMVDRAATVASREPSSGAPIRIRIEPATGQMVADPAGVIVFAGSTSGDGAACERACPFVNFFHSDAAIAHYRASHPELDGRTLSLAEAVAAGKRLFANRSRNLAPPA